MSESGAGFGIGISIPITGGGKGGDLGQIVFEAEFAQAQFARQQAIQFLSGAGGFSGAAELDAVQRQQLATLLTKPNEQFANLIGVSNDLISRLLLDIAVSTTLDRTQRRLILQSADDALRRVGLLPPLPVPVPETAPPTAPPVFPSVAPRRTQAGGPGVAPFIGEFLQAGARGFARGTRFLQQNLPLVQLLRSIFFPPQLPSFAPLQFAGFPAAPRGIPVGPGGVGVPRLTPSGPAFPVSPPSGGGRLMPFVETSFLSGLAGLAGAVGTAVQQFRQPTGVFPASFQVSPATPALFGLPTFPEARQFMGEAISGGNCIVPTIDCKGVARFPSEVIVPKQGGGLVVFKNMGKAILMSGDLAACKRVRRIQKRVARAAGKR